MNTISTNTIYVIGHINPDADAICSAMGYAWLLQQERPEETIVAARAGHLNPQTIWIFQRLGLDQPLLLPDASPRFSSIARRFNTTAPDSPLREAWPIANRTGGVAPVINADGTPLGLVTGASLFNFMGQAIGSRRIREDMRVTELFDHPCLEVCDTNVPRFSANARIRDSLSAILREERDDFLVIDEKGKYVGVCRQADALHPPRLRIVMVDHNEAGQALGALDEAEVIEILDHHRLGNQPTRVPIKFTVDPVGSTCTLVSERIDEAGFSAPPEIAGLLLSGLISDTLLLTSPTTTDRDQAAANRLARWAFIGGAPLEGETLESYGRQLLEAGVDLTVRKPIEIVGADFKRYEAGGLRFGIGQVEITNFAQVNEHLASLRSALSELRDQKGLNFAILMITNVVNSSSRLIFTDDIPKLDVLPYPRRSDGTRAADDVVSRKKQLLPLVLSALEQ